MNILPKKRWHVRTKENIARVRKDEAEAAEQEKERIQRAKLAEQEARTAYLRDRARSERGLKHEEPVRQKTEVQESSKNPEADIYTADGNINFFKELEEGKQTTGTNKEHEEEKKAEQEKYEKSIGYLTYLGQDTLEAKGEKSWYEKTSIARIDDASGDEQVEEIGLKTKNRLDPINDIIKYTGLKPKNKIFVPSVKEVDLGVVKNVGQNNVNSERENKVKRLKRESHKKKHKKMKKKHKHSSKEKKRSGGCSKFRKRSKDRESGSRRKRKRESSSERDSESRRRRKRRRESSSDRESHRTHRKHSRKYSHDSSSDSESTVTSSSYSEDEEEKKEKEKKLQLLRAERLKREEEEKKRAEKLLAGQKTDVVETLVNKSSFQQRYNSQYNPHIARQNQETKTLEAGVKYWLQ